MDQGIQTGRRRNQLKTYFPRELVREVLVRLPVKSLLRFKCACKEWFTLIGDPQFAKSQLQLSIPARESGIIYRKEESCKFSCIDLDVERGVVSNFDFNVEEIVGEAVLLIASCNGLLLLRRITSDNRREYSVCNPLTKCYSKLPQFSYGHGHGHGKELASLCYDSLTQKFKVSIVFKDGILYKCAVFTLGKKELDISCRSWRVLDIPVTSGLLIPTMHPINGAMYWMMIREPLTRPCILQMDLASEEFSLIDNPVGQSEHIFSWGYSLHKMMGSLCLAVSVSLVQLDLWILNDAVKQAWSKEFSINFRSIIDKFDLRKFFFYRTIFMTEHPSRPVIIFFGSAEKRFLLYDLFTGHFKVANNNIGMHKFSSKFVHVNSFISF